MIDLSAEQQRQKSKIRTGSMMAAGLVALSVATLTFFATGGLGPILRGVVIIVVTGALSWFAYRTSYNARVAKAVCKKCGTAFGIREVERSERVISLEQRREIESLKPATADEAGVNRVTTWTEEKVEVTAVDECANCHDRQARTWTMSRDKDKTEEEVPA